MKKFRERFEGKWLFYGMIFIILILLCYMFPYTNDDWDWGTSFGMEQLNNHFANYNGRWLGNISVIILTRNKLLRTLVMAFVLVSILYFVNGITRDNENNKWLSLLLLVALPTHILCQAVVWTSGFSNYALSTFFILLYIYCNRKLFADECEEKSKLKGIFFSVLGFVSCLFIEHVTFYAVVLAIGLLIYKYVKFKKISLHSISYLIGCILGTILMFSNSAYANIISGNDVQKYRSLGDNSNFIIASIRGFFRVIYKQLIFNNNVLNIILSICLIIFLYSYLQNHKKSKLKNLVIFGIMVLVSFPVYSILYNYNDINIFLRYSNYVNGLFSILYLAVICSCVLLVSDEKIKKRLIFSLLSICVLTLPLFVVRPIGSRCFLPMYILWILIAIDFFTIVTKNRKIYLLKPILLSCIVVFTGYLFMIYVYIFKMDIERENYIATHREDNQIVLPELPYEEYHWHGNPMRSHFVKSFKEYYGIPKKTKLEFVDLDTWDAMGK